MPTLCRSRSQSRSREGLWPKPSLEAMALSCSCRAAVFVFNAAFGPKGGQQLPGWLVKKGLGWWEWVWEWELQIGQGMGKVQARGSHYAWHAFNTRYLAFQAVAVASCQLPAWVCVQSLLLCHLQSAGYRSAWSSSWLAAWGNTRKKSIFVVSIIIIYTNWDLINSFQYLLWHFLLPEVIFIF